jgi:hypothetical protein
MTALLNIGGNETPPWPSVLSMISVACRTEGQRAPPQTPRSGCAHQTYSNCGALVVHIQVVLALLDTYPPPSA